MIIVGAHREDPRSWRACEASWRGPLDGKRRLLRQSVMGERCCASTALSPPKALDCVRPNSLAYVLVPKIVEPRYMKSVPASTIAMRQTWLGVNLPLADARNQEAGRTRELARINHERVGKVEALDSPQTGCAGPGFDRDSGLWRAGEQRYKPMTTLWRNWSLIARCWL